MFHVKHGDFVTVLAEAVRELPQEISRGALEKMAAHWELLLAWNQRVNLTSVVEAVQAAEVHYRDSLEALSFLPPGAIVDIGSGGGFPGVPLAIAAPEQSFTLLEPRRKRASFLQVAVSRLGLTNVRVVNGSSRDAPDRAYDAAVTRATFSDPEELSACLHWVRPGGVLLAYRASGTATPEVRTHAYNVRGAPRLLEFWPRSL